MLRRKRHSLLFALVVLLSLLLGYACASAPNAPELAPEALSVVEKRIYDLAVSDPEAAFHELFIYPEFLEFGRIVETATDSITQKYLTALEEKSWDDAERLYSSMMAIAASDAPRLEAARARIAQHTHGEILKAIHKGKAEKFKAEGLYAPAVFSYLSSLAAGDFSDPPDPGWISYVKEAGDEGSLEALGISSHGQTKDQEAYIRSASEGVVTIYVDKGLKIEGGRGYPDRVVGSAFQIDPSGYYLTNYHVIASEVDPGYEGYSRLSIRPLDRKSVV